MPRLTDRNYYKRYVALKHVWEEHELLFSILSPQQQWDVHRYYGPSTGLLVKDCKAHRRQAVEDDPSLPHRASKACIRLVTVHNEQLATPRSYEQHKGKTVKRVSVSAVVRPEIDWERYAWALLQHARELVEQQKQSQRSKGMVESTDKDGNEINMPTDRAWTDQERHAYALLVFEKVQAELQDE